MKGIHHFFFVFILFFLLQSTAAVCQESASVTKNSYGRVPAVQLGNWVFPQQEDTRNASEESELSDLDEDTPPVASDATCSLPDVLQKAGEKVLDLVRNVDRFTSTEVVQNWDVTHSHRLGHYEMKKFSYMVSLKPTPSGYVEVEEYRKERGGIAQFPNGVATLGTPSLVLIFHPMYAADFKMKCEGLSEWRGQPAWRVSFEQLPGRFNHMAVFRLDSHIFDMRLRGQAWILASSYQVARLQTTLAEPIQKIHMWQYRQENEYGPVYFAGGQTEIWLPLSTQLYADFSHYRFYRRHLFTDFQLFSVNVQQVVRDLP